jgi:hypothetical protein
VRMHRAEGIVPDACLTLTMLAQRRELSRISAH